MRPRGRASLAHAGVPQRRARATGIDGCLAVRALARAAVPAQRSPRSCRRSRGAPGCWVDRSSRSRGLLSRTTRRVIGGPGRRSGFCSGPTTKRSSSTDLVAAGATNQKRTPPCYGLPRLVQPSGDLGDDLASGPAAKRLCPHAAPAAPLTRKQRRPRSGQSFAGAANRVSPANRRDAC
jgi:hypothetical protein